VDFTALRVLRDDIKMSLFRNNENWITALILSARNDIKGIFANYKRNWWSDIF
jgi:hypothetical protein